MTRRLTVIGDAVNVAAPVEAATKTVAARVLISDAMRMQLGDSAAEWAVHRVSLPGKMAEFVLHHRSSTRFE